MPGPFEQELIELYQQMYELTNPKCKTCPLPFSCCDSMYCEVTMGYAEEVWGVTLHPTNHPTLPLMGPTGCTAAPHLRPICTIHYCYINSLGFLPGSDTWTDRYFKLRDRIEELEWERFKGGPKPVVMINGSVMLAREVIERGSE